MTGTTSGACTAYSSRAPEFSVCFSGVRVTRSLVLFVCFVDRCLSFCTFTFGHYVVCPSSIYGFWLPLWYLQTLLITDWPCGRCNHIFKLGGYICILFKTWGNCYWPYRIFHSLTIYHSNVKLLLVTPLFYAILLHISPKLIQIKIYF